MAPLLSPAAIDRLGERFDELDGPHGIDVRPIEGNVCRPDRWLALERALSELCANLAEVLAPPTDPERSRPPQPSPHGGFGIREPHADLRIAALSRE